MKMGTYNFYLELSSKAEDAEKIAMTLTLINNVHRVKSLGLYPLHQPEGA